MLLPPYAEPLRYQLDLDVLLESHRYTGHQVVDVSIVSRTARLQLHSRELTIDQVSFTDESKRTYPCEAISFNLKRNVVTFDFENELPVGIGKLAITFAGSLNNQMAGFYRSTYVNIAGERKLMASTQFEAVDARRCFPCWDEPARKAVFACSLTVPSELTALSNMPESEIKTLGNGRKKVRPCLPRLIYYGQKPGWWRRSANRL